MRAVTPHSVLVLIVLVAAGAVALAEPPRLAPMTSEAPSLPSGLVIGMSVWATAVSRAATASAMPRWAACSKSTGRPRAVAAAAASASWTRPTGWEQIWHSPDGIFFRIRGGLEAPGDMLMTGTVHFQSQDTVAPLRGRWTRLENGGVRQYFEQYDSTEMAWRPWFEGFYARAGRSASAASVMPHRAVTQVLQPAHDRPVRRRFAGYSPRRRWRGPGQTSSLRTPSSRAGSARTWSADPRCEAEIVLIDARRHACVPLVETPYASSVLPRVAGRSSRVCAGQDRNAGNAGNAGSSGDARCSMPS